MLKIENIHILKPEKENTLLTEKQQFELMLIFYQKCYR